MKKRTSRSAKPNATGRSEKSGRFVMLPNRILDSAAYASLNLVSRALLTELVMLYNGDNNGSIYLSALDATARLGLTDKRATLRAFDGLQRCGFIVMTKDAYFEVKAADSSRARCWRLTWLAWPESPVRTKRVPTNEWQQYQLMSECAETARADKRLRALAKHRKDIRAGRLPGVIFTPLEPVICIKRQKPGVDLTPGQSKTDAIQPFTGGVKITPYIDPTMGCTGGWWSSDRNIKWVGQRAFLALLAHNSDKRRHLAA